MSETTDTTCPELDTLLACPEKLAAFVSICPCDLAKKIGTVALLRVCLATGQACNFDSLTVDGLKCGGDSDIRTYIYIAKCMQDICRDAIRQEHIRIRTPKKSIFASSCSCRHRCGCRR